MFFFVGKVVLGNAFDVRFFLVRNFMVFLHQMRFPAFVFYSCFPVNGEDSHHDNVLIKV